MIPGQNSMYCFLSHMPLTGEAVAILWVPDITVNFPTLGRPGYSFPGVRLPELMDYLLTRGTGPLLQVPGSSGTSLGFLITATWVSQS